MSRNSFGRWGLGLSREDFAAALASLGTERIANWQAYEQVAGEERVEWSLRDSTEWPDAGELARRWRLNLDHHDRPIRLKIRPTQSTEDILPWIVRQLVRHAGVDAVSIDPQFSPEYVHWTWPLEIGIVTGPGATGFKDKLKEMWTVASLARVAELVEGLERPLDVLLFPWDLRESLQRLLAVKTKVRASFLVVLGGAPGAWQHTRNLTASLAVETGAQGACLASIPDGKKAAWVESLMREVSHNSPLDLCVMAASRQIVSSARARFPVPYLFATDLLLAESRLSAVARRLSARMAALGDRKVEVSEAPAAMLNLPAGSHPGTVVADELETRARALKFSHESAEATALAELSETAGALEAEAPQLPTELRWIQGKLFELPATLSPNQTGVETRFLRAEVAYRLNVRVGPADAGWLAPSTSPFPDWELPRERQGYWLQVVFSEPHHAPQPQIGKIFLPPGGPSSTCEFFFRPLAGKKELQARILILFENRVLQTALLDGIVYSTGAGDRQEVTLRIEDAVRAQIAGLESRQAFDAALVVNHTPAGAAAATTVVGEEARLFSLENMQQAISQVADKLSDIALNVDAFPQDVFAPATVDLLRFLAFHGRLLYDALEDQLGLGALAGIRRVQLVSALPESFLPLELLYEKPVPDRAAALCPKAKEALRAGSCKDCLLTDRSPAPLVCPIGFWSTTRIIERHAIKRLDHPLTPDEFALQAEPVGERKVLSALGPALFGASEKVRPTDTKNLLAVLQKQTNNKAQQVSTWKDWETEISRTKPSLLVILCHTLDDPDFQVPAMEIGKDILASGYIGAQYVRATPQDAPPVVLLLGCESLCRSLPFQGFVPPLRRGGAAIVVATISTVLGRHVAPVAKAAISLLKRELKKKGAHSFGEVMPILRRQMLGKGIPMVFALFAYGDADWQLKAE